MNNFCIVFLTSTRQHHNLNDVDEISFLDYYKKSTIFRNCFKLVHIKIIPGQELIAKQKKDFYEKYNCKVICTTQDWQSDHPSHGIGLISDMAKCYSFEDIQKYQYVLHLENDWIFNVNHLDELFLKAVNVLEKYQNIIYFRYTREDQLNINERLSSNKIEDEFFLTNKEFSFNPFFSRVRDMKYISLFVYRNFNQLHPHCEMAYEIAAKYLLNNENIFMYYNNNVVMHIGEPINYNKQIKKI